MKNLPVQLPPIPFANPITGMAHQLCVLALRNGFIQEAQHYLPILEQTLAASIRNEKDPQEAMRKAVAHLKGFSTCIGALLEIAHDVNQKVHGHLSDLARQNLELSQLEAALKGLRALSSELDGTDQATAPGPSNGSGHNTLGQKPSDNAE